MRSDFADITVVLDRSGSMATVQQDTIGGFNTFIEAQRKVAGKCNVSLVQFDNQFETVFIGKPVKEVPELTTATFIPRGMTALLDAIGMTIRDTGIRLAAMAEQDRPDKVLFVILTDGQENASKEYSRKQVFEMISHQKETYQWNFVFLGANQNAIRVGETMGVSKDSSMTFTASAAGTRHAFASVSNYASTLRTKGAASFTDEDRKKQQN